MSLARMTLALAVGGASVALTVAGCTITSEENPGPTGPAYPTATSFCEALATAVCNAAVVEECSVTPESCVATFSAGAVCNPGGYTYNDSYAEACIAKASEVYLDAKVTSEERDALRESCMLALSDGGLQGTDCLVDQDCDTPSGLRCVIRPGTEAGSCEEPVEVGGGESCTDANAVCSSETQYCDGSHCVAMPTAGEPCNLATPCDPDSLCAIPVEGEDGSCTAKKPAGDDTCLTDEECVTGFCDQFSESQPGRCTVSANMSALSLYCTKLP